MKTNTKAAAAKTSALGQAVPHAKETVHADPSTFDRAYARWEQAQSEFMAFLGTPTWKRTVIAAIAGIAVTLGLGWVAGNIVSYLMVGALMATNSLFLTMALGIVAGIYLAIKAGKFAARVFGAILTGEADERAIAAYDATRNALARLNPMKLFASKVAA